MGSYILCQTKRALKPYFIENIAINIYTIEELCYYLYNNLYLVDNTIINPRLCEWLGEELGLTSLADKLRNRVGKFSSAEDVLYPVFKEINYLTYEELKQLNGRLKVLDSESAVIREKRKADALVENGMYSNAEKVYIDLLRRKNLDEERPGLEADILHNLGCIASYLFQMDKALEYFGASYEKDPRQEYLICYLLAYRSVRTPLEYESRMEELKTDDATRRLIEEKLEAFARRPETPVYRQHVDDLLRQYTREYHRSTSN